MSGKTFVLCISGVESVDSEDAILQELDLDKHGIQFLRYQEESGKRLIGMIQMKDSTTNADMLEFFRDLGIPEIIEIGLGECCNAKDWYAKSHKPENRVHGGAMLEKGTFVVPRLQIWDW